MASILRPFFALYATMFLLATSLGLLATFLSLRLTMEGFSPNITGLILTAYFLGSVVGTVYCGRLIKQFGHIRSFGAFTAAFTAMIMLHGCFISAPAWAVFRFISGIAVLGMFMVIESWLNESSQPHTRGRVFSLYMIMSYLGVSIGQQLLNLADINAQTLFFIAGFLLVVCMIPITLTHQIHPQMADIEPPRLKEIVRTAPMGMVGCFTSGLIISAFYTMGPVFAHQIQLDVSQISMFMTVTVLGGLMIQWPIGTVSDRFDRSIVIPSICIVFAVISGLMIFSRHIPYGIFMSVAGIMGGFMCCIYPVSVARTHDLFESRNVVSVSSALLLFYYSGAAAGPVISSAVIELMGSPYGFYAYMFGVSLLSALFSIFLRYREIAQIVPVEEQSDFLIMGQTSQVSIQIDPRSDPVPETETPDNG